jgi:hypothetical protein
MKEHRTRRTSTSRHSSYLIRYTETLAVAGLTPPSAQNKSGKTSYWRTTALSSKGHSRRKNYST